MASDSIRDKYPTHHLEFLALELSVLSLYLVLVQILTLKMSKRFEEDPSQRYSQFLELRSRLATAIRFSFEVW